MRAIIMPCAEILPPLHARSVVIQVRGERAILLRTGVLFFAKLTGRRLCEKDFWVFKVHQWGFDLQLIWESFKRFSSGKAL